LGAFLEATGPGASVRGLFSAEGVLLVRWASANFDFFRGFFTFLVRFLPVFGPYFALFPSMPCAYLYVNNFFPVSLAWNVRGGSPQRAQSTQRKAGMGGKGETANGTAFNAARPKVPAGRAPFLHGEHAESAEGDWGGMTKSDLSAEVPARRDEGGGPTRRRPNKSGLWRAE